jgi:sulfatase modifying factor 1
LSPASHILAGALAFFLALPWHAMADGPANAPLASVPAGAFESVLPPAEGVKRVSVAAFRLDRVPVTNAQFARFVQHRPEWQRDRVARIFADTGYLHHWASTTAPGNAISQQPVVHVSWFAASAYCEARGARLPRWHEWEFAAAASETEVDARTDPVWRQRILDWYSKSARSGLPDVGRTSANVHGVRDLHGVVWEWVEDLGGMLVAADNRQQGDPDMTRFCGTGALTMEQKENYATLMRIAMLSSMQASYTSATMGFRCAEGGVSKP